MRAVFFSLIMIASVSLFSQSEDEVIKSLTDDTFEKSISKGVVVVDFWATWCGPCRMQAPRFKDAAFEMRSMAKFYKVDVDICQTVASVYNIASIPTIIVYKDGKVAQRMVGLTSKEEIISAVKAVAAK